MHCRRVRSYLSAFSNDELIGALLREVREHLATCPECRREEAVYRSIRLSARQFSDGHVKPDFNTRLMDRLAQERFAETRTKAYLPHRAPRIWWRLAPVAVSAVAVLLVAISFIKSPDDQNTPKPPDFAQTGQDNSYLTVQPRGNPNMTANLKPDWSLNNHMAQSDRLSRLTNSMTEASAFSDQDMIRRLQPGLVIQNGQPYLVFFYREQPVIRVYDQPGSTNAAYKESDRVYRS
ncbi:MAG: zf-HC2 domain-containing protein [candidate division Zixibacteria bacterium]|nr:zf-HC2 domain-containing protein [candidate division Zixibacteria bacterium]